MGFPINGDLVPSASGRAHLGVDGGPNAGAFDFSSIRPFGHVHLESGVWHNAASTGWESGVIRYNGATPCFEISTDGGISFGCLATTDTTVTSVGVLGDANLTGDVDFATRASGFMVIEDSAGASPLLWAVDNQSLSGFWDFPAQGFNGRVVNAFIDFHGTEAQGVINVVGASGIIVDIIGQTMTIASDVEISSLARCYSETFSAATSWTVNHALNTADVSVMVLDDSSPRVEIMADEVEITDVNNVTVSFNIAQGGRVIIIGC